MYTRRPKPARDLLGAFFASGSFSVLSCFAFVFHNVEGRLLALTKGVFCLTTFAMHCPKCCLVSGEGATWHGAASAVPQLFDGAICALFAHEAFFFCASLVCRSFFRELQGTRQCCSPHRREKGSAITRTKFRGRHVRQTVCIGRHVCTTIVACMCQGKEAERKKQQKRQSCEAAFRETATTPRRRCLPRRRA